MRIQACLNGARAAGFHPALPLTAEAMARDAAACGAAGAVAVHLHPRGADGRESLAPEDVGRAVRAVRGACGLPVSVSTGAWILADDAARRGCVAGWAALGEGRPDEASVNLSEADAPGVMAALLAAGVGVEAGVAGVADALRLAGTGLGPRCRRVLVEIPAGDAPPFAEAWAVMAALEGVAPGVEVQLHGEEGGVWPLFGLARRLELMARLGLEDGARLPDGSVAPGNAALVAAGMAGARA